MADTNQVGGDFRRQPATFDNPVYMCTFLLKTSKAGLQLPQCNDLKGIEVIAL